MYHLPIFLAPKQCRLRLNMPGKAKRVRTPEGIEEPRLLAGAGSRWLRRAPRDRRSEVPGTGAGGPGQAPASAHAAGRFLPGARRARTQPAPRLTHREGPARGPAQRWCTAPPARSAPPSASPSCRRPSPLTSATGPRLPPAPCPRVHRAALPDLTNRSRARLGHQAKAIEGAAAELCDRLLGF